MTAAGTLSADSYQFTPEPGRALEAIVARADRTASTLLERQAETEHRGRPTMDTHGEFLHAGLYRIKLFFDVAS